ncbi:arginine decarboxylase [Plautia stali symbiont]|nr:arginine decarboxylase [Plautia stali symbiont]
MSNIRDIATGVLGVDYEGTRSQSDCSVNYGLNEYANNVIWAIGDACEEHGLEHPTVITESGLAVTAHHTVLVSNIIGVERNEFSTPVAPDADSPRPIQSLWGYLAGDARAERTPFAARMAA